MKAQKKLQYTLEELTQNLEVTIQGDPTCIIKGVCTIQEGLPHHITFLVNPAYKKYLSKTCASAVILREEDAKFCTAHAIITSNPYYIYAKIAAFFDPRPIDEAGIHPKAVIEEGSEIDPTASIGANSVIKKGVKIGAYSHIGASCVIGEETTIGEHTVIDANVTTYHGIKIGNRVRIGSGTVIGSDGFGIAKHQGSWHKIPQIGGVILQDEVEIGANCAIDRGAIGNTLLEKGVKLDNLIQVGHNVKIGENTAIAGCVGISGSTIIGKNCLIGGAAGIAGHISIADNVVITGGTEVTKSIREPGVYSSGVGGVVTNMERRKNTARVQRLDHLIERVKKLELALKEITERKEQ